MYDFKVKKAYLFCREGSVSITGGILMKVVDDTGTPQTIVAERAIDGDDDAGAMRALTVADEGPILTGAEVQLDLDSNTSDTAQDVAVTLLVEPVYK